MNENGIKIGSAKLRELVERAINKDAALNMCIGWAEKAEEIGLAQNKKIDILEIKIKDLKNQITELKLENDTLNKEIMDALRDPPNYQRVKRAKELFDPEYSGGHSYNAVWDWAWNEAIKEEGRKMLNELDTSYSELKEDNKWK